MMIVRITAYLIQFNYPNTTSELRAEGVSTNAIRAE